MKAANAIDALGALAHPSRLSAFRLLVQAGHDGLSVGQIRAALELAPATLSAHLNVLRAAGLVHDTREGRVIRVRADYARMDALVAYLTDNCCGGMPCTPVAAACTPVKRPRPKARHAVA